MKARDLETTPRPAVRARTVQSRAFSRASSTSARLAKRLSAPLASLQSLRHAKRLCALGLLGAAGCSASLNPGQPAPHTITTSKPADSHELPPLSARERLLVKELRRHVKELSGTIGERNVKRPWELASAADYIALEWESIGYALERQGFEVGETVAQNIEVVIPGTKRAHEVVVVGAHYDSARGSSGADDNASGVAALLELSKLFREVRLERTLRFVAFANAEPPFERTPEMGSLLYAKRAVSKGENVVGMISIDSIGRYSELPGTQRSPAQLEVPLPNAGDFIAVFGNKASRRLALEFANGFPADSVELVNASLDQDLDGISSSDHWSFWQVGYEAIVVTDTGPLRARHAGDDISKLDFNRMARVVTGLEAALVRLGTPIRRVEGRILAGDGLPGAGSFGFARQCSR